MNKKYLSFIFCLAISLSGSEKLAETFSFNRIFTSNMVLQREMPIRISGQGTPASSLKVQLGGHRRKVQIGPDGQWQAEFPALPAGGPYTLMLTGAPRSRNLILDNILIGEVWFCSGQSNMSMPLFSKNPHWRAKDALRERNNARHPRIRLFNMPTTSLNPLADSTRLSWQVCTPENAGSFSALAYFYGRELERRLNVPVGLIHASWPGTAIETWIPPQVFQDYPGDYPGELKRLRRLQELKARIPQETGLEKKQQEWFRKFNSHDPAASKAATAWKSFQYKDSSWEKISPPWQFPAQYAGTVWFRNSFSLPAEFVGGVLELHLSEINDSGTIFFNGREIWKNEWMPHRRNSGRVICRIPAGIAMRGRNSLAIRIINYAKDGGLAGKADEFLISKTDNGKILQLPDNWKMKPEFYIPAEKLQPVPVLARDLYHQQHCASTPGTLFTGMVEPWQKFPVRGVIWYQGCGNSGQKRYFRRHQQLISSWRQSWNQPDMTFLLVQLSGFHQHRPDNRLPEDFWKSIPPADNIPRALTREIQAELTAMPGVGMAVSIDRGDHSDIHPRDKQTVAARLAEEALRIAYRQRKALRSPVYEGMRIENDKIRIYFKYAEPRLMTSNGKSPGGFAIAGKDGRFVWASAQIIGSTVLVYSPEVPHPTKVRYGWVTYRGDLNLCSSRKMPAVPFRTDKPEYTLMQ